MIGRVEDEPVPRDWIAVSLKAIVTKLVDGSHNPPSKRESGVPMLSARNVLNGQITFDGHRLISKEDFEREHTRTRISPGDVLLTIVGTIGRSAVVPASAKRFSLQRSVAVITPRGVLPKYLMYQFQAPFLQRHFEKNARGTAQKGVYLKTLGQTPILVAPLGQQELIVAEIEKQFSRLDEAVANLKRVKANLKRYKASVLKVAVEGCLVPTEAELSRQAGRSYQAATQLLKSNEQKSLTIPTKRRAGRLWGAGHVPQLTPDELSKLPEGWTWAKVRQVGSDPENAVQVGPMSMRSDDFKEAGVPVLNVGCVQWGRFDETKLNFLPEKIAGNFSRYRIQPGDVLFTRSGTVGRCAVAKSHQKNWLMTFHLLRARPNSNCCLPEYLRAVFEGAAHIRRQTREASIGTTRAGFNTNLLAYLDVPLPPMAEQQRIVAEIERRLSVIEELEATVEANLTRADRLRQSILSQAFSGGLHT